MKKAICDLCGEPALDDLENDQGVNWGRELEGYEAGHPRRFQPRIVVSAHFSFNNHPTGFGGPPDLCAKCAANLIRLLVAVFDEVEAKKGGRG